MKPGEKLLLELGYRPGGEFRFEAVLTPYVACRISLAAADGALTGPVEVLPIVLSVVAERLVEARDYRAARAFAHQWLALHAVRAGIAKELPAELIDGVGADR